LGVGQRTRRALVQGNGADQRALPQHRAAAVEVREIDGVRPRHFDEIRDRGHRVERRAPFVRIPMSRSRAFASPRPALPKTVNTRTP